MEGPIAASGERHAAEIQSRTPHSCRVSGSLVYVAYCSQILISSGTLEEGRLPALQVPSGGRGDGAG
jgi:hypothetical protein